MSKRAKAINIGTIKVPLITLGCLLVLTSCTTIKPTHVADYQQMDCPQITAEIEKLNSDIAQAQTNAEIGRVANTGSTVAVQGASLAGVPYIGGIFSIGKTLMNHNKQTKVSTADIAKENLFNLEGIAYEKGCLGGYP